MFDLNSNEGIDWLSELIKPITKDKFFSEYWENKYLNINNNGLAIDKIINIDEISELIGFENIRKNEIRMVKNGSIINKNQYLQYIKDSDEDIIEEINADEVLAGFHNGQTIILESIHKRLSKLSILCRYLEKELNCNIRTNLYLTPPDSQGFLPHYDNHDVIILQIYGEKEWTLYESENIPISKNEPGKIFNQDSKNKVSEFILRNGDILYIPRGYIHSASTNNESSAHLTIGIHTYTWEDLLIKIIKKHSDNLSLLHESIPYYNLDLYKEKYLQLSSEMKLLFDSLNYRSEDIINLKDHKSDRPLRINGLKSINNIRSLNENSLIGIPSTLIYEIKLIENRIYILFNNRQLTLSYKLKKFIDLLTSKSVVSIQELNLSLDNSANYEFIKKLIVVGFLDIFA